MLDWIKFFPFASGNAPKPTEIRGPYFSRPRENKWYLGDSLFYFAAPRANPIFSISRRGRTVNSVLPGSANILTANLEPVYGGTSGAPPSFWDRRSFYYNIWYFVGPWFTGEQACLEATGLLLSAEERLSFADINLFHPRGFELAIADFLDYYYGYDRSGKKPHYRGPLNWRVLPISSSIQGVVCDIHSIGNGSKENPLLDRTVFFPVSPRQFIRINFNFGGTAIYQDEMRAPPLFKLCDSIIDSMRLQVGESTQAEWDKVKVTCPDMAITENFGELPWPLIKEKPSKKSKTLDITPSAEAPKAVPFRQ
jgi:hypothetical protein